MDPNLLTQPLPGVNYPVATYTPPGGASTLPTWVLPLGAGLGTFLLGLGIAFAASR